MEEILDISLHARSDPTSNGPNDDELLSERLSCDILLGQQLELEPLDDVGVPCLSWTIVGPLGDEEEESVESRGRGSSSEEEETRRGAC